MTPFAGPLPSPLSAVRTLRIRRARRAGLALAGRSVSVDGFQLLLPDGTPAPLLRGGVHPDAWLARNLGVRRGERVLVAPPSSGIVALHAAAAGCHLTVLAEERVARALERSLRLAGLGAPEALGRAGLGAPEALGGAGEATFDAIVVTEAGREQDLGKLASHLRRGGRLLLASIDRDDAALRGRLDASDLRWTTRALRRDRVLGPIRVLAAWRPRGEPVGYIDGGVGLPGAEWVLRDR